MTNKEILNDDNSYVVNIYDPQYKSLSSAENKINNENTNRGDKEENETNDIYELSGDEDEDNEWKEYHENILVDWADKAMCYRWLHSKSCAKYTFLRNLYTIPVIILSTLTGTANFALQRVPDEYQGYAQIGIGSLNIIAGIITTISQFLKINELCESHRVSSISWDKFYRNIRVELVKSPNDRTNVSYIIKSCKDEFDRLMETSPIIDSSIIKKFNITFKTNSKLLRQSKNETIKSISKPEILDSFESTKNIVFKQNAKDAVKDSIKNKKNNIQKENIIEDFVDNFNKEYNRKPSVIEIYDNLESKVSEKIIDKYLTKKKY
jgi:hypothetical protein